MKKEYFISAIGYDGIMAVVDKRRFRKNARKSLKELLEGGSYRAAAAMAVYDNSDEEKEEVINHYNQKSGSNYTKEQLGRLFGVANVNVKKVLML
ncbi:MAG: hypothetical protein ACTTKH_07125 [Treponema sp.]